MEPGFSITLTRVTFDRFERACQMLSWDPDEILHGGSVKEARLAGRDSGLRFLMLLTCGDEDAEPPPTLRALDELDVLQVASMAAIEFFTEALRQVARASRRAYRYAYRCGVESLLSASEGGAVALAMAVLDPSEETHLRRLPLGEMMYRLGLRGIKHLSDNLNKHLA